MAVPGQESNKLLRRTGFWQRLSRLLRFRLAIPMLRSRHSPEHAARGTMVGLVWAMTPSVGIQMPLVFVTWIIGRRLFNWDFSLLLGLAWTWVTNAFTLVPTYYLFYLTGQVMLGHWGDLSGYERFAATWGEAFSPDLTLWQQVVIMGRVLLLDWGVAMWLGSIPWAIVSGWLGYRYSLKFVRAHRHARAERMARRHSRHQG
ncbi:hypothetical protein A8950_1466 [Dongia mobilis]|uniref:DUF2062 domain-containing protein n=1 Tax=Dongia mobilis TaxID=578943 RepID=A0A4R6WPM9_9PROT|nr:hypothetical protein A8950_1466 [Dongia mobilis]